MSVSQTFDTEAFRDFEHSGWESNVLEYHAAFARLTARPLGRCWMQWACALESDCSTSPQDRAMRQPPPLRAGRLS